MINMVYNHKTILQTNINHKVQKYVTLDSTQTSIKSPLHFSFIIN